MTQDLMAVLTTGESTYTMASGSLNQTVGCIQSWPWDGTYYYHPVPYYVSPSWCSGPNVHVFACEHATTCRCGKATRELPKCAHCGK